MYYSRLEGTKMRLVIVLLLIMAAAIVSGIVLLKSDNPPSWQSSDVQSKVNERAPEIIATPEPSAQEKPEASKEEPETPLRDTPSDAPAEYSPEQAASLTVVVNKKHKLPSTYVPTLQFVAGGSMRPEAAGPLTAMLEAAKSAGAPLRVISSYRSYALQTETYNRWVRQNGQSAADRYSARPGHSEHQTGLGVDVGSDPARCDLEICFGDTPAGQWIAAHVHKFGFIVRYGADTEAITGYQYEPWHLRYVGEETATLINNSGKTLEEYFDVSGGDYN